ncbi:MAG: RsmD family RNA methyltransferase [Dehalococcoidia bacterium]
MAARGLRVIGGTARGIELRVPKGGGTRPTTGRLREALFAMLEAAEVSFAEVLDLYAGSGALGIEALSRGSGNATFVESDRQAGRLIRENLERTRFETRGGVIVDRVGRWRPPEGIRYTLILADPPYRESIRALRGGRAYDGGARDEGESSESDSVAPLGSPWREVQATVDGSLSEDAAIVVEHDAGQVAPDALAGLTLWRDRRHGAEAVAIYRPAQSDG